MKIQAQYRGYVSRAHQPGGHTAASQERSERRMQIQVVRQLKRSPIVPSAPDMFERADAATRIQAVLRGARVRARRRLEGAVEAPADQLALQEWQRQATRCVVLGPWALPALWPSVELMMHRPRAVCCYACTAASTCCSAAAMPGCPLDWARLCPRCGLRCWSTAASAPCLVVVVVVAAAAAAAAVVQCRLLLSGPSTLPRGRVPV